METGDKKEKVTNLHKNTVHHVLAHSYSSYFLFFIIGITLDAIFSVKVFNDSIMASVGFSLLVFASIVILWAQRTSRDLRKIETIKKETFCKGPYCYTRSPTHWGLFLLMLGFGIMINAFFVIILTVISLAVTKLVFLKKEEEILVEKYGAPYIEYKKLVRF